MAYIGNNATRDVSISGSARTSPARELIFLMTIEDSSGIIAWYSRVPSSSNIAEAPSRGRCDGLYVKFFVTHTGRIDGQSIFAGDPRPQRLNGDA